jgi:hypothetical protein
MRPIDRYKKEAKREAVDEANKAAGIAPFTQPPGEETRKGPLCTSMFCTFQMPDGTNIHLEGVWPSVDHLALEVLACAVVEKATKRAEEIRRRM